MTSASTDRPAVATSRATMRVGAVSFVNTLPLVEGLGGLSNLELRSSVPSLLIDQLLAGEVDVALASSVDYQCAPEPLVMLPAGLLGCDGPTLTVRLFSERPLKSLERVFVDTDSHTSVALMRLILRDVFDVDPECVPYAAREHVADNHIVEWPEAMLLIGDKVVTDAAPAVRYPYQLDLGAAWRDWTDHPFAFAIWMARASANQERLRVVSAVLDRQRRANRSRIPSLITRYASPRGWPEDLATKYLTESIRYEVTPRFLDGIDLFFEKLSEHKFIAERRPLVLV